jgi:hypothetical protein
MRVFSGCLTAPFRFSTLLGLMPPRFPPCSPSDLGDGAGAVLPLCSLAMISLDLCFVAASQQAKRRGIAQAANDHASRSKH